MGADSQYCVQKKYALFCPFFQAAVVRNIAAQVTVELFINVYQRRRNVYIFSYREAKTVGLSIVVVGILTQNNYFYIVLRGVFESIKHILGRGEYFRGAVFFHYCFI